MIHIRHDITGTPLKLEVPYIANDPWRLKVRNIDDGPTWIVKNDELELELSPDLIAILAREIVAMTAEQRRLMPPVPPQPDEVPVGFPALFGVPATKAAEPETERWR